MHCKRGGKDAAPTEDNRKGTEMNNRLETAIKANAAEARLTGMDENEFAALCRDIFREGGGGGNA